MRFGTRTENKRKWTPQGHRPLAPMKIGYEFSYLYLALKPYTGEVFAMILPYMNTECFNIFVKFIFSAHRSETTAMAMNKRVVIEPTRRSAGLQWRFQSCACF